jgi:hypothetical protein
MTPRASLGTLGTDFAVMQRGDDRTLDETPERDTPLTAPGSRPAQHRYSAPFGCYTPASAG